VASATRPSRAARRDRVLPRLQRLRPAGGGQYKASCPVPSHGKGNGDRNPSLSVGPGRDQPVVFRCQAGCDQDAVKAALVDLGIDWALVSERRDDRPAVPGADDWMPCGWDREAKRPIPGHRKVAEYLYRDADGMIRYGTARCALKGNGCAGFAYWRPDSTSRSGRRWSLSEQAADGGRRRAVPHLPYRLPEALRAIEQGRAVWVCYADDTEVLTPTGWTLLAKLPLDVQVAQYHAGSGSIDFVAPVDRQRFAYTGDMVDLAADWCGLLVTPEHRVLTRWAKTRPVVVRAEQVREQRWLPVAGLRQGIGASPTPAQARLIAAWQADGVNTSRGHRIGWNIRKERKKTRLRHLLTEAAVVWREQEFDSTPGWTYLTVDRREAAWLENYLPAKRFHWGMLNWSVTARQVLLDELGFWDGDRPGREGVRYFTADEQCAEVVSALAAISGYGSIVRRDDRPERPEQGPQWIVNLVPRDWRTLGQAPNRTPYDGNDVYCLTVPSGFLVTRRLGKVTICGNCEGEKDADRLASLGYPATCNDGGAGKWNAEYTEHLAGADIIIVADRDAPGWAHAEQVAEMLLPLARSIEVVRAVEGKDASDHLDAGYRIGQFVQLAEPLPAPVAVPGCPDCVSEAR
jgi:hypothetical protein